MTAVRWAAWEDRTAHAVPARVRPVRTACGIPALDERLEWPPERRCEACLSIHPPKEVKHRRTP